MNADPQQAQIKEPLIKNLDSSVKFYEIFARLSTIIGDRDKFKGSDDDRTRTKYSQSCSKSI